MSIKLKKWDFKNKEYGDITIANSEGIILFTDDMEKKIKCISCGAELIYGEAYTSKQYHTEHGLGYPVCEKCYRHEIKLEIRFKS